MPIMNGYLEAVEQSLYDTFKGMTPNTCRHILFQTPVGQNNKTFADTNMVTAGSLPPPQQFIIRRLRMEVLTGSSEDLDMLKRSWIAELIIGCKPYWRGPVSTLLLEDWLRKSLREIEDAYAGRDTPFPVPLETNLRNGNLALGGMTPTVIETGEAFQLILTPQQQDALALSTTF